MFSHIVIFWTDPANPKDADDLLAGCHRYLKSIPGVMSYHAGKMVGSPRPVVDQSYHVAVNLVFPNKKAQDDYQVHPMHIEFLEKVFRPLCKKAVVYDFE
ncbi:MAG: Dabb family protein [Pedosphaera sp.]|nr:Dabb family protein [Pedosphaera sp.]